MQQLYHLSGHSILPSTLVFHENDYLVLLKRNATSDFERSRVEAIIPPLYHNLKMVAHVPLAVFVILLPFVRNQQAFPRAQLKQYQER